MGAIELTKTFKPDVVISDYMLQDDITGVDVISGRSLLRGVRLKAAPAAQREAVHQSKGKPERLWAIEQQKREEIERGAACERLLARCRSFRIPAWRKIGVNCVAPEKIELLAIPGDTFGHAYQLCGVLHPGVPDGPVRVRERFERQSLGH